MIDRKHCERCGKSIPFEERLCNQCFKPKDKP
jgi:predicted nucleic acid-binding Zn ribbon protein